VWSRPARSARTCAVPRSVVVKRSATRKPEAVCRTTGPPRDRSTAPAWAGARAPEKVAVTDAALSSLSVQVNSVPLQAPDQPLQAVELPPVPGPVAVAVAGAGAVEGVAALPRVGVPGMAAVRDLSPVVVTGQHADGPEQAPPQPVKPAPEPGVAVIVTLAFAS